MPSSSHRLLTAEREQRILSLLRQSEVMSVGELSAALGASPATVRRDLASMHERGVLARIHGGATSKPDVAQEKLFSDKEAQLGAEKARIAEAALSLICDHDKIYLDGGSTILHLAKLLSCKKDLTIVTNSLMAAFVLMESGHQLILTGGKFRALSRTLVGPLSAQILDSLTVDKAFMGTLGFTLADGLSTSDTDEAFTKRRAMQRARQVILLADHTKLGVNSFVNTGKLGDVDILVTDQLSDTFRNHLEQSGTQIIIA